MHTIEDFDQKPPLSSFLPGVAGRLGLPMWVFYVNRGQGVCSFGIRNKDAAIMEFQPANKAWRGVSQTGFRTFLRSETTLIEPFSPADSGRVARSMSIGMGEFSIREVRPEDGLAIRVTYFTVPEQPYAGLVRRVSVENLGAKPRRWEVVDGMPAVVPYGADDGAMKSIARTIEAWMRVTRVEEGTPFYRLGASAEDTAEISAIRAGQYAVGVGPAGERLPIVVDPHALFAWDTALASPRVFEQGGLEAVQGVRQVTVGKTPSAFATLAFDLPQGASRSWALVVGHAGSESLLTETIVPSVHHAGLDAMQARNRALVQELTDAIGTRTSSPRFDAYCRQTYLDNGLRGGVPICFPGPALSTSVVHTYSRKHGDPERDYNDFFLAAEFYSQGNGNYRDVNQNRRCDPWFVPEVGDFNARMFLSLLQADGYNPLVVRGVRFAIPARDRLGVAHGLPDPAAVMPLLEEPFTPGGLLYEARLAGVDLGDADAFLARVMECAVPSIEADFGEGFWVDHWTYNLDLVESFLAIFPDGRERCLWGTALPFALSPARVRPRRDQYVLTDGGPRRLGAVAHEEGPTGWLRYRDSGEVARVPLYAKLVALAAVKLATLDPSGMGIDMEAGKPGWYDALNGLPGLFGSSTPEAFELLRLLDFLAENIGPVTVPKEVGDLVRGVRASLHLWSTGDAATRNIVYWRQTAGARETYRAAVQESFEGVTVNLDSDELERLFELGRTKLRDGIERARALAGGLVPTYLTHEPAVHRERVDAAGAVLRDAEGRPRLDVFDFVPRALPAFLEGYVRAMKVADTAEARLLHGQVMTCGLYDEALGMFKVNVSLADLPHDIGRCRAFTPGWLENESIWLHMAYKYMLELLRAGLYREFYDAFQTGLVAFMDPEKYGRSPLENSSFIASSAHPDASIHGRGFVARLSGSTAEFLHIWTLMMAGPAPFTMQGAALRVKLSPALPGWLFDDNGELAFRFLGRCDVTYVNPDRLDTFVEGVGVVRLEVAGWDGSIDGDALPEAAARAVRAGDVPWIRAHIGHS